MSNSKFLYKKVYDDILHKIESGKLLPNEKLKPNIELEQEYGVSTITLKKALTLLSQQGFIKRVKGMGTFVCESKQKRKNIIGVIFEHVATPFGLELMYTLDECARSCGYKLIIRFSYSDRDKENEEIDFLLKQKVDGIIVMPTHGYYYNAQLVKLILDGFPVVLIDKELKGVPVSAVINNNVLATQSLVEHLYSIGKKQIGFISSADSDTSSVLERTSGFYSTCTKHDITAYPKCEVEYNSNDITQQKPNLKISTSIKKYIQKYPMDAIVCSEYSFIPDLVHILEQENIRVPEDLSVCSIDEDYLSPFGFYFTHTKQDEEEIAKRAFECLINIIENKSINIVTHKINPILKIGRSTK